MGRADEIIATFKKVTTNQNLRFYNGTHLTLKAFQHLAKTFTNVELVVVIDFTYKHVKFLGGNELDHEGFVYSTITKPFAPRAGLLYGKDETSTEIVRSFIKQHLDVAKECSICTECDNMQMLHCPTCYYEVCRPCYKKLGNCPSCRNDNHFASITHVYLTGK